MESPRRAQGQALRAMVIHLELLMMISFRGVEHHLTRSWSQRQQGRERRVLLSSCCCRRRSGHYVRRAGAAVVHVVVIPCLATVVVIRYCAVGHAQGAIQPHEAVVATGETPKVVCPAPVGIDVTVSSLGRDVVIDKRRHGRRQVAQHEVLRRELERRQLVDLVARGVEQPLDHLAGLVKAEAVLQVVELDRSRHGEAHAPVAKALHGLHLAVAVLPTEDARDADDARLRLLRPLPRRRHDGVVVPG
jgi:hypothetical protein